MIGEKDLWGKGLGTEAIRLLSRFGFERGSADMIFALVYDYNIRSRKAFLKAGFEIDAIVEEPDSDKAKLVYDLVLRRERYWENVCSED
jgi:RimJ/RimL family protein N-acetyltransferase